MAQLGPPKYSAPFPTSETKSTTEYVGEVGFVLSDPANPLNQYMLVDCQESFVVGEIVAIGQTGQAIPISSTAVGMVGKIVATVSGSDTVAWAQISGLLEDCIVTSTVTSAVFLQGVTTGGGAFDGVATSADGNIVRPGRALSTGDGTSPGHGAGVADVFIPVGGAFVYGIATNAVTS